MVACNRTWSYDLVAKQCAAWPASERQRWMDLFAYDHSPRPWGPETAYQNAGVYTRYLSPAQMPGLRARGVRAFVRFSEGSGTCPRTVAGYVAALYKVGRLLHPDRGFEWLYRSMMRMERDAKKTPKQRSAVVPDAVELLEEGKRLIDKGRELGPKSARGRELFRTGLFICLGLNDPERLRALTTLRLDQVDLEKATIVFRPDQTKSKREVKRPIATDVVPLLREWIEEFRAEARPTHGFLWIAKGGGAPCTGTLYVAMRKAMSRLPHPATPHLLRNAAGTFIVREAPDRAWAAPAVLDHRSEQMTGEYTETASMIEATRRAAAIFAGVGRGARDRVRSAPRRRKMASASRAARSAG